MSENIVKKVCRELGITQSNPKSKSKALNL